jgi:adenylylsulfate reductase subunit A
MVTMEAFQDPHLEEIGWHNFLGMTVGQAVLWAATDVDPKNENPELTTVEGLFGAGDAVGGTPHAFSSGSFTEGRIAAKAACKYIDDGKAEGIRVSARQIEDRMEEIYKPMEHYKTYRNEITAGTVNPNYLSPRQGLDRLQKLMDEYCGGQGVNYMTNDKLLNMGLKRMTILEDIWKRLRQRIITN